MEINDALRSHQVRRVETDLPELFAPERSFSTQSIEAALEACEMLFRYEKPAIAVDQLFLEENLTLAFNGARYRMTEPAFDDLCALLKVPVNFVKGVPLDLRATIVDRLAREHQQLVVPVHRDGIVVGIVDPQKWTRSRAKGETNRPRFEPVTNLHTLQMIKNLWTDLAEPPRIVIADTGVRVEMLTSPVPLEPQPGDITRLGLVLTSSETGGPLPLARGYTLRLVCTNGAVLPEDFAHVRFNSDRRIQLEARLQIFAAQMQGMAVDVARLQQAYARLPEERLTDQMFYNLWRDIRYAYRLIGHNDVRADQVLEVDPEERRAIITEVRKRQQAWRDGSVVVGIQPPRPIDLHTWDAFNRVTAAARQEPYQRRLALERLAGRLLHAYMPESMN
jgi:hypothetical protein